jgi:hypothetical protein
VENRWNSKSGRSDDLSNSTAALRRMPTIHLEVCSRISSLGPPCFLVLEGRYNGEFRNFLMRTGREVLRTFSD